jgi:para-nitrobenzyl esterase
LDGQAHQLGQKFAQALGASESATLPELRAIPVEQILKVPLSIGGASINPQDQKFVFRPVIDGYVLPEQPIDVWSSGRMSKIPFMAGSLKDDGSVFAAAQLIQRAAGYRMILRVVFGAEAGTAAKLFPVEDDADIVQAMQDLTTIMSFRAPARRLVRWVEQAGGESYLYYFSRNPSLNLANRKGVFHGLEIPYVFGVFAGMGTEIDRELSQSMRHYWIEFARTGNPNGTGRIEQLKWPKYERRSNQHLEFGDVVKAGKDLDAEACDLMDKIAATRDDKMEK